MLGHTTTAHTAAMLGHRGPTTWLEVYSILHVLGVVCDGFVYDPACFTEYPLEELEFSVLPAESVTYCAEVRSAI